MNLRQRSTGILATLVLATMATASIAIAAPTVQLKPLMIRAQGSFAVGGSVIQSPGTFDTSNPDSGGQTLHGDHARVFYQIPVKARKLPLVMWHGFGQFSKTWESTPDGREGFQNIFLRRQFATYVIDQPRRGTAGRGTVGGAVSATPDDQRWFNTFRVGIMAGLLPRSTVLSLRRSVGSVFPPNDTGYRPH